MAGVVLTDNSPRPVAAAKAAQICPYAPTAGALARSKSFLTICRTQRLPQVQQLDQIKRRHTKKMYGAFLFGGAASN